jgi:hypothetical protein
MKEFNVEALNAALNIDGPKYILMDDNDTEVITETLQWYHEYDVDAPNKGRFWITDGQTSKMINGAIPEGWVKGRGKIFSEEGKKKVLNQLKHNNPNAKKYLIKYRNGAEEVVTQLSTWARKNGHNYGNIKSIVYRTKHKKKKQYECYNSPTYYIESIVKL